MCASSRLPQALIKRSDAVTKPEANNKTNPDNAKTSLTSRFNLHHQFFYFLFKNDEKTLKEYSVTIFKQSENKRCKAWRVSA